MYVVGHDMLRGCFAMDGGATVVVVPELLEGSCFLLQVLEAGEELPTVECFVENALEVLNDCVSPGFSRRNEDYLYPQSKTHSDHKSKRSRISIASAEAELVVELDEVGPSYSSPRLDESSCHVFVAFGSAGVDGGQIAFQIDDVEAVEAAVVLDVPGANKISLLDRVGEDRLHIRIVFP